MDDSCGGPVTNGDGLGVESEGLGMVGGEIGGLGCQGRHSSVVADCTSRELLKEVTSVVLDTIGKETSLEMTVCAMKMRPVSGSKTLVTVEVRWIAKKYARTRMKIKLTIGVRRKIGVTVMTKHMQEIIIHSGIMNNLIRRDKL